MEKVLDISKLNLCSDRKLKKMLMLSELWPCSDRKPVKDALVVRTQALFGQDTRKSSSSCPNLGQVRTGFLKK
jgi:hypothetical protein